ncbi:BRCA1-associated protein-like isoform X2 [Gouania willdenowi]|uniref:BRCA1-associated protein-like isoform X2 n=1 Tax=Gouania willdenowi TaxID=441366 RepID=UPI0010546CD8|nr:BRCA1-associated protein-like isoform X2 [Gouania willdenowi]XP_028318732.1 BRCA1-associated protein-like isoform X2 [Gouania willdenowi]
MSVSLVVIRLELADQSPSPLGFQYSAVDDMSDGELRDKALGLAEHALSGKSELERSALLHQHIGSRAMGDMVIETFELSPDKGGGERQEEELQAAKDHVEEEGGATPIAAPDSPSKLLPDQISFFSGNPSVEIIHGIMHLYKTNKMTSLTEDVRRSAMVCILTVPATMTSHDLMKLMAPFNDVMEHMKIIRDSTPNQYMVLIKFCSQADADSFYTACNGRRFNSIEEAVCQLVYVERAEVIRSEEGASLPVMELTELPKCTVCLERMDESVNGVLTTLCNHSFHSQCLQRWEDASCPVCRYCQTPEPVEENKCFECGVQENLWICLICGHIGCGRYVSRHAYKHFEETQHTYAMQLTNHRVWDYAGDNYVHRLVASKTDGKMVQFECEGVMCHAEKIDALQLEYSYLLTSQLESQRIYWENKIVHLEKETTQEINNMKVKFKETLERCDNLERRLGELSKDKLGVEKKCTQLGARVMKLSQELEEEQEMNRCLRANQTQLQARLLEEEQGRKESAEHKDATIAELQEQLRDVMFYLETQQQIQHLPPDARTEIQDGQINIPPGPSDAAAASCGRGRRGRGRKRKSVYLREKSRKVP